MYSDGDFTHYGQILSPFRLDKCWSQVLEKSEFSGRKAAVLEYNKGSRWRKRGICALPTNFGIAFTQTTLNQSERACTYLSGWAGSAESQWCGDGSRSVY